MARRGLNATTLQLKSGRTTLVWFRHDLRLADQPALAAARQRGGPVVPVFLWTPEEEGEWPPGAASCWWLHQSLARLSAALAQTGSRLILRRGPTLDTLLQLTQETGAGAVFWSRRYEPAVGPRDAHIQDSLHRRGIAAEIFNASLLHEPGTVMNQSGKPFQVFTPFWRACLRLPDPPEPLPAPASWTHPTLWPRSLALAQLELEPRNNWAGGLRAAWQPGENGARQQLRRFMETAFHGYEEQRNRPEVTGTSRLSPHLHFGEISPRQVWRAVRAHAESQSLAEPAWRQSQFLAELGWREFAHHLLHFFPHTPREPLRAAFTHFPWQDHPAGLRAWQQGRTGYPFVDAGLRELWATGWMHNRVRMVTGSFLVKNLLVSWQEGARWFWDTLVDADLANNTLGWQWVAGCGADAAPYFRIFNPINQGEKFDPHGHYVRRWVPELANLPEPWIHRPWMGPESALGAAGVAMGKSYPKPILSNTIAREVALEAYRRMQNR